MQVEPKKKILIMASLAFALLLGSSAFAAESNEIDALKQQLEAQTKILQQMQERLAQLEARQKIKEKSLDQKIEEVSVKAEKAEAAASAAPKATGSSWADRISISGDFRYRHEHKDVEEGSSSTSWKNGRDRHRIRARAMINAIINDEWDAAIRLATGSRELFADDAKTFGDPVSANQTLTEDFSSKEWWLDLAYFTFHPENIKGLNVYGGKMKNPFYKVGKTELIWDGDLNPEGLAASYVKPLNDSTSLHLNGGAFWVQESSSGVDTSLWGAQGYLKHTLPSDDYILGGLSYFDYGNIKGRTDAFGHLAGNTASPAGVWGKDYNLLEFFAEYGTEIRGMPVALFGDYVNNAAASGGKDTGWLVGTKINKCKDPGSWAARYNYRELDADAVLGVFTDSDFIGGGTNGKGHELGFDYQLHKNVQLALTYFHNQDHSSSDGRDHDFRMFQGDIIVKFK